MKSIRPQCRRARFLPTCCLVGAAIWCGIGPAHGEYTFAARVDQPRSEYSVSNRTTPLLREGDRLINQVGEFRMTGEAVVFLPSSGEPLQVLENLALERITKVLLETRGRREWTVSGMVTEFRGANYLLVTRAVLNART